MPTYALLHITIRVQEGTIGRKLLFMNLQRSSTQAHLVDTIIILLLVSEKYEGARHLSFYI